jgi:hypothetical protein
MGARILSVVDCFDALTSDRPYRPRLDDHAAMQVLLDRRGTMYDPRVVDAFCAFVQSTPLSLPTAPAVMLPAHARTPAPTSDQGAALDLQAFFELGRTLGGANHPDRACEILRRCLEPVLPPVTLVLYAYDGGSDSIAAIGEAGAVRFRSRPETRFAVGERLSGWVAATGQAALNADARLDLDEQERAASRFRSALVVRIDLGGQILGVLSAYSCSADGFTPSHQRLLQAAAVTFAADARQIFSSAQDFPIAS